LFYELIKEVDIFVENFSPSVKKRLKIDYETLSKINPRLIYGSVN
jgi:crotonobetainyl-CoA:carnitine CoA-transferase CaiB-like acyl-CoA transferase